MSRRPLVWAEDSAFSFERAIQTPGADPDALISYARRLISEAQLSPPSDEEIEGGAWDSRNRRKLDSAARIVSSVASRLKDDASVIAHLRLLASLAFALDGNHTSAGLSSRPSLDAGQLEEHELVALGVGCPLLAAECRDRLTLGTAADGVLAIAASNLTAPVPDLLRVRESLRDYHAISGAGGAGFLFGFAIRSHESALELRFDRLLAKTSFPLKDQVLSGLAAYGRVLALPAQRDALQTPGVLGSATSVFVSLPTGAGKTAVGLIALASTVSSDADVMVYLAPYHAIRRQVEASAIRLFGSAIDVVVAGGSLKDANRAKLVVDTPEGFDARLKRTPELRDRIRAVVLDEAHLLGSERRGVLADGLLTRLAILGGAPNRPKLILLSAVLDREQAVLEWLSSTTAATKAASTWKPAARRVALWKSTGELQWIRILGEVGGNRDLHTVAKQSISPESEKFSPVLGAFTNPKRVVECDRNVAALTLALNKDRPEPTLLVVASKSRTRSLARELYNRVAEDLPAHPAREKLCGTILQSHALYSDLVPMVRRGVAHHSAALPVALRNEIERACEDGGLMYVVSTTSLAEGADLPFGRCVLADWTLFEGAAGTVPFRPALFRNIAGRCGRPSSHIEGETIIVEMTPPDSMHATQRGAVLRRMLTGDVEVAQTLPAARTGAPIAAQQLVAQAIAAVREQPGLDEPHAALISGMLASKLSVKNEVAWAINYVESELLDGDSPLATRNSPIRLSPLGEVVAVAPLLPSTVRTLGAQAGLLTGDAAERLCVDVLMVAAGAVELQLTAMPEIAKGRTVRGLWVKQSDLSTVVAGWLGGADVSTLLLLLAARDGRTTVRERERLVEWFRGQGDPSDWRDRYEKLQDFVSEVLIEFLPRAIMSLRLLEQAGLVALPRGIETRTLVEELLARSRSYRESAESWESA